MQGCSFWGIFHIAPHLESQKPQFWRVNRCFQAKVAKSKKPAYYQNYCINSNQILHSDKDQMPFVGGPDTHTLQSKIRYISAAL